MTSFLISLLVNAVVVLIVAYIMPKVEVRNFGSALLVAFLIGILNPTIGWLIKAAFNVATLGLVWLIGLGIIFRIIAFAIVIKIVDALVGGFKVHGFTTALILAIVLSVVGYFVDSFISKRSDEDMTHRRIERVWEEKALAGSTYTVLRIA